jgi:hypothetical protein
MPIVPGEYKFLIIEFLPSVAVDYWTPLFCILKVSVSKLSPVTGYFDDSLLAVSLIPLREILGRRSTVIPCIFHLNFQPYSCLWTVHNLRNSERRLINQVYKMLSLFSSCHPRFYYVYATASFLFFLFVFFFWRVKMYDKNLYEVWDTDCWCSMPISSWRTSFCYMLFRTAPVPRIDFTSSFFLYLSFSFIYHF